MGKPEKKGGFWTRKKTYAIVAKVMKDDMCTVNSANPWWRSSIFMIRVTLQV